MAFDRRGQRHDRVRARVEAAQLSLILRSKLNLNGVIKDGYQVARGSSRLKYCLQIRYQLRTPFVALSASADFINLSGCRFVFAIGQLSTRRTRSSIRASLMHPGCGCDRSSVAVESRVANFQQADAIKMLINGGTV